jgi:hypothetical protein
VNQECAHRVQVKLMVERRHTLNLECTPFSGRRSMPNPSRDVPRVAPAPRRKSWSLQKMCVNHAAPAPAPKSDEQAHCQGAKVGAHHVHMSDAQNDELD